MALFRMNDFNSSYRRTFGDIPIHQFHVYTEQGKTLGQVDDVLVDPQGHFQQLVVTRNGAIAGNAVLLPMQHTRVDQATRRVYVVGLSDTQLKNLAPADGTHHGSTSVATNDGRTAPSTYVAKSLEMSAPLESSTPLESSRSLEGQAGRTRVISPSAPQPTPQRHTSVGDAPLPQTDAARPDASTPLDSATVRLLEERLVIERGKRRKVGEVVARKVIETHMVEIPIRREKLIIEQVSPEYKQLAVVDLDPMEGQSDPLNVTSEPYL